MKPLSLASLALTLSVGGLAGLALPVAPAAAQNGVIRCESQNNRERVCNTGWRSAQMVRQLSGSSCVEGRTWGSRNGSIWVTNGCRAEFVEGRGGWGGGNGGNWGGGSGGPTRCDSSNNNRTQNCDWDERQGRPVLQQQLSGSACQEGRSWGYSRGQVWVSNGCRARFGTR